MALGLWPGGGLGAELSQIVREGSGRPLCDLPVGQEDHEPPLSLLTGQEPELASKQEEPGSRLSKASASAAAGDVGGSLGLFYLLCETWVYFVASFNYQRKDDQVVCGAGCHSAVVYTS